MGRMVAREMQPPAVVQRDRARGVGGGARRSPGAQCERADGRRKQSGAAGGETAMGIASAGYHVTHLSLWIRTNVF